jgi:hypothetical protein
MFSNYFNLPFLGRLVIAAFLASSITSNVMAHSQTEEESQRRIKSLISSTFDQPNLKVITNPIVIEGKVAIADWTQGSKGGRALLRRKHEHWEIIACGGAGFKEASGVSAVGISKEIANNITAKLKTEEAKLSAQTIKQFDSFEGVVNMAHGANHTNNKH